MQIQRQKIALYAGLFLWLVLFGVESLVISLIPENKTLETILLVVVFLALIGIVLATRFFIKDDMIHYSEQDDKIFKVLSYGTLAPISILILIDYLIKDNPALNNIIKMVAAILLMIVGIFGAIYFSLIAFKHPKPPQDSNPDIIDADFEEKPNLPN